jgi:phosphoribosyl 1,2-cyclic phosphodiesterase
MSPPFSDACGADLWFCVLASGSQGNAIYVSDARSAILIDAGLSGAEIERRMRLRDLDPAGLSAIVVSHEHGDHVRGVGVLARRYGLAVYTTPPTAAAAARQLGRLDRMVPFAAGEAFAIGRLRIQPFATPHDAVDSTGFTVQVNGAKLGIATDLGVAPALVRHHLCGCGALILEANHDPRMLIEGPYPWPLKQRIQGRTGHLSNEDSRDLLGQVRHDRLEHVVLAHLSETNNTAERALAVVSEGIGPCRPRLTVARQDLPCPLIAVGPGPARESLE